MDNVIGKYKLRPGMKETFNSLNGRDGKLIIIKGDYQLVARESVFTSYNKTELARVEVNIYHKDALNNDIGRVYGWTTNPVQTGINKMRWMVDDSDKNGEFPSIKKMVDKISPGRTPYGVTGMVNNYWDWPCVIAFAHNTNVSYMIFKSKQKYIGLRHVHSGYTNVIDRIDIKDAFEGMDELINASVSHSPIPEEHKAKLISMMI